MMSAHDRSRVMCVDDLQAEKGGFSQTVSACGVGVARSRVQEEYKISMYLFST